MSALAPKSAPGGVLLATASYECTGGHADTAITVNNTPLKLIVLPMLAFPSPLR